MDEPKNNMCKIIFDCNHSLKNPCAYYTGRCSGCYECSSSVAKANRMESELEKLKSNSNFWNDK